MNKRLSCVQRAPHLWEAYCQMKRTVRLETGILCEHGAWAVAHTTTSIYKTSAATSGKPALYLLQWQQLWMELVAALYTGWSKVRQQSALPQVSMSGEQCDGRAVGGDWYCL